MNLFIAYSVSATEYMGVYQYRMLSMKMDYCRKIPLMFDSGW